MGRHTGERAIEAETSEQHAKLAVRGGCQQRGVDCILVFLHSRLQAGPRVLGVCQYFFVPNFERVFFIFKWGQSLSKLLDCYSQVRREAAIRSAVILSAMHVLTMSAPWGTPAGAGAGPWAGGPLGSARDQAVNTRTVRRTCARCSGGLGDVRSKRLAHALPSAGEG